MKQISKFNICEYADELQSSLSSYDKGSESNPYSYNEYERLVKGNSWYGGWVKLGSSVQYVPAFREDDKNDGKVDFMLYGYSLSSAYSWLSANDNPYDKTTTRYWGSKLAVILRNDCMYRCIGYMAGAGSIWVSNMFGDYLKSHGYIHIDEILSQGIGNTMTKELLDFVNRSSSLNVRFEEMDKYDFNRYLSQNSTSSNPVRFIICKADANNPKVAHAYVVKGEYRKSKWNFSYEDPQNYTSGTFTYDDIRKIDVFYVKQ